MDDRTQSDWSDVNWRDLLPRLMLATMRKLGAHPAFRGKREVAEDLVYEACRKLFEGDRVWDEDRCSLYQFLLGVIKSDLSNLARKNKMAAENADNIVLLSGGDTNKTSPENILLYEDTKKKFVKSIKNRDGQAAEIVSIIFNEGISNPAEISKTTDMTSVEVTNVKKRLKRNFRRFLQCQLPGSEEGQ